jgi:hypothetical protein
VLLACVLRAYFFQLLVGCFLLLAYFLLFYWPLVVVGVAALLLVRRTDQLLRPPALGGTGLLEVLNTMRGFVVDQSLRATIAWLADSGPPPSPPTRRRRCYASSQPHCAGSQRPQSVGSTSTAFRGSA